MAISPAGLPGPARSTSPSIPCAGNGWPRKRRAAPLARGGPQPSPPTRDPAPRRTITPGTAAMLVPARPQPMSDPGGVLGMNDAARALGVSRRALQEIIKRHPFYMLNGRAKLFDEQDRQDIKDALRGEARELWASKSAAAKGRATGSSAAPSAAATWKKLRGRLTRPRRSHPHPARSRDPRT